MPDTTREEALRLLESEYGICGEQIYLLPAIPLIEMLWVDGLNQGDEALLVYDFVDKHLALISELAEGELELNLNEAQKFLGPLIENRPPPGMLAGLRKLANNVIFDNTNEENQSVTGEHILDYCMDIAAAAVTHYPYNKRDRFVAQEKALLRELCESLG